MQKDTADKFELIEQQHKSHFTTLESRIKDLTKNYNQIVSSNG